MTSSTPSFAQWLTAGCAAGIAADVLFFPVDTLKTRLQSAQGFIRAGGFRGVYKGIGSVIVGSTPSATAFFATYDTLKQHLPMPASLAPLNHVISSSVAEVACCVIHVPMQVVKTRSQTSMYGRDALPSITAARRTYEAEGIRGFYRGFGITTACEIPVTAIQFPLYELLKTRLARYLDRKPLFAHEAAICAFISGAIAGAVTTPLDVLKTRVMLDVQDTNTTATLKPTFRKHLLEIYKNESLLVLFSGIVPRTLWISSGGAVFLGVYEWVMHRLRADEA